MSCDCIGRVCCQVSAKDPDLGANGDIVYSITNSGGLAGAFTVNNSTGVISLSRDLKQSDVGVVFLDLKAEDRAVAKR